jgi:Phytanoyl-CoA dioxygenase (PhyH)
MMSTSTVSHPPFDSTPSQSHIQPAQRFARSPFWLRALRRNPYIYSAVCKSRLAYSRRMLAAHQRAVFQANQNLLRMNDIDARHCHELSRQGFTVLPEFVPVQTVDRIFEQADGMFKNLRINMQHAYSVQNKTRTSLAGVSYGELAASEKVIALHDLLVNIPECTSIVFDLSILRILANFLGFIPPLYLATLVRDFPHNRALESSNFHKDNDEADSVQIFIYLVDIDDTHGPLVYIQGTNHYDVKSCRPRLSRDLGINANDGRLSDAEVEKHYPQEEWSRIKVKRGSVALIHGNGIHKGPAWLRPGDPSNQPRTAIKIDVHGPKPGVDYATKKNVMRSEDYAQLTALQRLFAHESLEAVGRAAQIAGQSCLDK